MMLSVITEWVKPDEYTQYIHLFNDLNANNRTILKIDNTHSGILYNGKYII